MKVKLEIDIPNEDYATLTKWLKFHLAENTIAKVLERGAKMDITKWLIRAREHMETGKTRFERFTDEFYREDKDV